MSDVYVYGFMSSCGDVVWVATVTCIWRASAAPPAAVPARGGVQLPAYEAVCSTQLCGCVAMGTLTYIIPRACYGYRTRNTIRIAPVAALPHLAKRLCARAWPLSLARAASPWGRPPSGHLRLSTVTSHLGTAAPYAALSWMRLRPRPAAWPRPRAARRPG